MGSGADVDGAFRAGMVMDKVLDAPVIVFRTLMFVFVGHKSSISSGTPPSYSSASARPGGIKVVSMNGNSMWAC